MHTPTTTMPPRASRKPPPPAAASESHWSTGHKHKKSAPKKNSKKKDEKESNKKGDKAIGMRKSPPESSAYESDEDDEEEEDDDDVLIPTDSEGEEELRSSFPKVNSRKSSYVKPDVSNMEASEAKVVLARAMQEQKSKTDKKRAIALKSGAIKLSSTLEFTGVACE
jgi:hypothetical protein